MSLVRFSVSVTLRSADGLASADAAYTFDSIPTKEEVAAALARMQELSGFYRSVKETAK